MSGSASFHSARKFWEAFPRNDDARGTRRPREESFRRSRGRAQGETQTAVMVVNMTPKGVFWLSSSVACLGVGSFAVYFMLVYIPNRDSLLAQVAAESARAVRIAQLEDECANRAKSAAQQFVSEQRLVDRSTGFMGFSNHYNRQLQKCVVEIDTASSGSYAATSSRTFVDAHENAILMTCRTVLPHDPKLETKFECQDADLVKIPPEQEDKKLKAIMSE